MTQTLLTPAAAYGIASQWGSLISAGDPGAVFYAFRLNDGRPNDDAHRAACIAYAKDCLADVIATPTNYDDPAECEAELAALIDFFKLTRDADGKAPLLDLAPTEGFNSTTQPRQGGPLTDDDTWNSLSR